MAMGLVLALCNVALLAFYQSPQRHLATVNSCLQAAFASSRLSNTYLPCTSRTYRIFVLYADIEVERSGSTSSCYGLRGLAPHLCNIGCNRCRSECGTAQDKSGYLLILPNWNLGSQSNREVSIHLIGPRHSSISVNAKSFPFDLPFGSTNNFHFKAGFTMNTNLGYFMEQ